MNDDDEEEWGTARAWRRTVYCGSYGKIAALKGPDNIHGTWKLVRSWKPPLELNLKAKYAIRSS